MANLRMEKMMDYQTATKPAAEKPVLAWDGLQWVRAMWVPKHSKEQNGDGPDDWTDYSEEHDTFYWPEGWYELQSHGGDEILWHLTNGASDWQDLPPPLPFNARDDAASAA